MLKAVLFDLDDTLLDWEGWDGDWTRRESLHLSRVYQYIDNDIHPLSNLKLDELVTTYSVHMRSAWAEARSTMRAPHMGEVLRQTLMYFGVPEDRLDIDRCLDVYRWSKFQGTVVFPDVVPALKRLQKAGVSLGVVTNAAQPMRLRDLELEEHGLLHYFPDCRFSAADAGYVKPHPNIFTTALDCIGAKPEEAVYIGDNPVADVGGARGAGLKAVLRVNGITPSSISDLMQPVDMVKDFTELFPLLDSWFPGWESNGAG